MTRLPSLLGAATVLVMLTGCAAMTSLTSEVSSYSAWPTDRKPGSYAFERLPSQQTDPERQQQLEDSARRALEGAGFTPAAEGQTSEYTVQLGARVGATEAYYGDPFWLHGGLYYRHFGRPGPFYGLGWSTPMVTYSREVGVLIRERKSGQSLYETHATNDGGSPAIASLLPAMFDAAMKDFPAGSVTPRRVTTQITPP